MPTWTGRRQAMPRKPSSTRSTGARLQSQKHKSQEKMPERAKAMPCLRCTRRLIKRSGAGSCLLAPLPLHVLWSPPMPYSPAIVQSLTLITDTLHAA